MQSIKQWNDLRNQTSRLGLHQDAEQTGRSQTQRDGDHPPSPFIKEDILDAAFQREAERGNLARIKAYF